MGTTRIKEKLTENSPNKLEITLQNPVENVTKPLPKEVQTGFIPQFINEVFKGFSAGLLSSIFTYPFDKINFVKQTADHSISYRQAVVTAFKHPFAGLGPTAFNACVKSMILFPLVKLFENLWNNLNPGGKTNKAGASFCGGMAVVGLTNPIAVVKAFRFKNIPIANIWQMPWSTFYRGTLLKATCDGVHWGVFFPLYDEVKKHTDNPLIPAVVANMVSATATQPLATLTAIKRLTGENAITITKRLVEQEGPKALFRGLNLTLARMGIFQGAGIGGGLYIAKKICDKVDAYRETKNKR